MPVTSSGRIVKSRKIKKGTLHQKNHRYESFTTKISKLNSLDPIRRVRRQETEPKEELSLTTSYLRAGLEKWQELNLSEKFISFAQEISPFCDSLAHILHEDRKIMGLFVKYLELGDKESLEPLLELITAFAHDLGLNFHARHYEKTLEMVTRVATSRQDAAVIEWSFTCLAFLYKYLSKLLVPDLIPTYDIIAPLLGKQRQRPHIARFAAEAMSYLIKKAGTSAHRDTFLLEIVQHAKADLQRVFGTKEYGLYYHGVMTLFAEAMKGNGMSIHTSGPAIFKSLMDAIQGDDVSSPTTSPWVNVICGVLTSIVHHTNSYTFRDLMDLILKRTGAAIDSFTESSNSRNLRQILFCSRAIRIMAGVRKGTRISDWQSLLNAISMTLTVVSRHTRIIEPNELELELKYLVSSTSIIIQHAPMDSMIPFISPFMDCLVKDPLAKWFLIFCSYLSEADPGKFRTLTLPYFQRFVIAHWTEDNGDAFCVLLPKLVCSGVLPKSHGKDGFSLPQSWQDQIVSKFERLEVSPFPEQASPAVHDRSPATWHDRCLPKYNALLEVMECTAVHPSTNARIAEILLRKLKLALRPSSSLAPEEANFIVGRGFSAFSRMVKGAGETDKALKPLLRAAAPRYARLPEFLEALLEYEKTLNTSPGLQATDTSEARDHEVEDDMLVKALVSNLRTASHKLRLLSLRLLDHTFISSQGTHSEALSVMTIIEQTPLDLQSARSASMHIRKLATLFANASGTLWMRQAIASFCFGMLTVKFAQIWEDVFESLKQICLSRDGEEFVTDLAFDWLAQPSMKWEFSTSNLTQAADNRLTDFECSNLIKTNEMALGAESRVLKCRDTMLQRFADAQELVPKYPLMARAQALKVLNFAPAIAEKRSRQLVPMFLTWTTYSADSPDQDYNKQVQSNDWTGKDRKAQLDLFCKFTNSRSLYKSEEVYDALLQILTNGDIEIQKSALKALFTWKSGSIKPYEENLLNLLDEARFKEEIAIFFQGQTLVQPEHRPILMPVLLRLLYGRAISSKGAASGRLGMESRRLTVLRNLGNEDITAYLNIALGELKDLRIIQNGQLQELVVQRQISNARKQLGFIKMIEGVLKELGAKTAFVTERLVEPVLYCMIYASRQSEDDTRTNEVGAGSEDEDPENATYVNQASLYKAIRQIGLKCLVLLFTNAGDFDWSTYIATIERELIKPRLTRLPEETAQSVSGMLRLFSVWSRSSKNASFLACNPYIIPKIADCLVVNGSKDEVQLFVLSILKNLAKICGEQSENDSENDEASLLREQLLTPTLDHILENLGGLLRQHADMSKNLRESCVETISQLGPLVTTSKQAQNLVNVSVFLLNQPSKLVNPKIKANLLKVLEHFVPKYDLQVDETLKDKVYKTITSLFGFFKDRSSREVLTRVLRVYSLQEPVIEDIANVCVDLNSFTAGRLDEPDYDRRLRAFRGLQNPRGTPLTARQWTPILYNLLFYITHDEEHGILSTNSSDGICNFISMARESLSVPGQAEESVKEKLAFKSILSSVLLPALYTGVKSESEFIRREYVKVMAHLVRNFHQRNEGAWSEVSDMHNLLAGEEELEKSFFNNILTAGKGRQSSALSQVSAAAEKGELTAKNVSNFLIPLIEHFVLDRAEGNEAHNLASEATTAVGILASSLEWSQYRSLLKRYVGYVKSKSDLVKQMIRLVGKVTDSLTQTSGKLAASNEEMIADLDNDPKSRSCTLSLSLPDNSKLADDITSNLLPLLIDYLHEKDESTVSLRVPVAVIAVKLLKILPEDQKNARLPAILTDTCQILRSKAQESRDMTRDTLTKICTLLGPEDFGFVLKELRSALARGSQLHVLSFTMHSLLVETVPLYRPGDLDYCLPTIVAIIMDDIFGATGQEKDAEDYVSKMKEVKSSKSHDSMELIARTATLNRLTDLVRPIQILLKEKLNLRTVRKIDELLNAISRGLLKNIEAHSRDSLVLCWEIIEDIRNSDKPQQSTREDFRLKKYLIQKAAKKSGDRGTTTIHTYKLIRFALEVLRTVLKRNDDLRTWRNLENWIKLFGDAMVDAEEEVKIAVFKLLSTTIHAFLADEFTHKKNADGTVEIIQVDKSEAMGLYRVAVIEATKCISSSQTTSSDISQAALKLLSVVLPYRKVVPVKITSIDELLVRVRDDIVEPERRNVVINFLRSILSAKFETSVIYDTMDYVGTVMVTNDDQETRDLARNAYFQFLRNYPQKEARWKKQVDFIIANLKYDREGGRLSILEVIHLLLSKSDTEYVQKVAAASFVPLVFVLVNDEKEKCRMAAGELLKEIFRKSDKKRLETFLLLSKSWIKQVDNPSVVRLALQTYGFYYDSNPNDETDVAMLQESIVSIFKTAGDKESDWEQIYFALRLQTILVGIFPNASFSSESKFIWEPAIACLSYPHAWVKSEAASLTLAYFTDFARTNAEMDTDSLPLEGSGGLKLQSEDISDLIRRLVHIFKMPGLSEELAGKIIKNLAFLGKISAINNVKWKKQQVNESDDEDQPVEQLEEQTALHYLFTRLSFVLRRETSPPRSAAVVPKTSALDLLEILVSNLAVNSLIPCLQTILFPLHNITDPSIPTPYSTDETFRTNYESLKTKSFVIQDKLRHKVGTTKYSEAALRVSQGVRNRRLQRSAKRKVEAVSMPERAGEGKRKKTERKKERRKEKGIEHKRSRMEM